MQHTNFEGGEDNHEGEGGRFPPWPYVEKTLHCTISQVLFLQVHLHVIGTAYASIVSVFYCYLFIMELVFQLIAVSLHLVHLIL
jgi:hypothetical protein